MRLGGLAALVLWAAAAGGAWAAQGLAERTFDPAVWPKTLASTPSANGGEPDYDPTRTTMVRDLVDSHRLMGLTKAQVIELLGTAEDRDDALTYDLGAAQIGDFGPETLTVLFSRNGVVEEAITDQTVFGKAFESTAFDPAKWPKTLEVRHEPRTPGSGHWLTILDPTRAMMADDLAESGRLVGKTRAEVQALLGEADEVETAAGPVLIYALVPAWYLMAPLDDQGRVTTAQPVNVP